MSKETSKNQPRHKGKFCKVPEGYVSIERYESLREDIHAFAANEYNRGLSEGAQKSEATHFHYGYIILAFVLGCIVTWAGMVK